MAQTTARAASPAQGAARKIDNHRQRQHDHRPYPTTGCQAGSNPSPKQATCHVCGGSLTLPYITTPGGLVHARCQQFPRRDLLPPTLARRPDFRSRVRGVSAVVAALALEAEQGGDEARSLSACAYELARIAAGLKAVIA